MTIFFATFLISCLGSFTGAISGGGSGLILLPGLLLLGIKYPLALSTYRLATVIWTATAAKFHWNNIKSEYPLVIMLTIFGGIGSVIGTYIGIGVDEKIITPIVAIIVISIIIFMICKPEFGIKETPAKLSDRNTGLLTIPFGIYEGFFGAANGIFVTFMLCKVKGFQIQKAMAIFFSAAIVWCGMSSIILIANGYWDLKVFIPAILGAGSGSYLGTKLNILAGNQIVKKSFIAIGGVIACKLLIY